eukprot:3030359-Amphidinium_carterae.1
MAHKKTVWSLLLPGFLTLAGHSSEIIVMNSITRQWQLRRGRRGKPLRCGRLPRLSLEISTVLPVASLPLQVESTKNPPCKAPEQGVVRACLHRNWQVRKRMSAPILSLTMQGSQLFTFACTSNH